MAVQEAEQFRKERTAWERQIGELQGKCAGLDEEKYEAVSKVRDSIQLAEETTLQKDQVTILMISIMSPLLGFMMILQG